MTLSAIRPAITTLSPSRVQRAPQFGGSIALKVLENSGIRRTQDGIREHLALIAQRNGCDDIAAKIRQGATVQNGNSDGFFNVTVGGVATAALRSIVGAINSGMEEPGYLRQILS